MLDNRRAGTRARRGGSARVPARGIPLLLTYSTGMTISLPEQSPQQRRTARIAGWLMALTFLTSIPAALILYDPVLNDTDYILGAGDDTRVTLGAPRNLPDDRQRRHGGRDVSDP
jgi:hypothetical protein